MTKLKKINLCICLSHEIDINNELSSDSIRRLEKTATIFNEKALDFFVTTGWSYKDSMTKPLSSLMSKAASIKFQIPSNKILELPEAKDTVGEALFLKKLSLNLSHEVSKIYVITSDWHSKRAKEIFKYIFNNEKDPSLVFNEIKGSNLEYEKEKKNNSINKFRKIMINCKSGDFDSIFKEIMTSHPLYNSEQINII